MASGALLRIAAGAACLLVACDGKSGPAPNWVCMVSSDTGVRGDESRPIAQVDRCPVAMSSFRFAYSMGAGGGETRRHAVVDGLIARELLAQAALDAGDSLKRRAVEKRITNGELYVMGQRVPAEVVYRDGTFDHDAFVKVADRAGMSVNELVAEQEREMLALKMREQLGEPQVFVWLTEHCKSALAAGRLSIIPEVLERFDDDGKPLPDTYVPCAAWGTLL